MAINFGFRRRAVRQLTTEIGVYVLCDLNQIPIYVGKSVDGIRARVSRHLTSARSDIIANRQIDVWEIAYVWAFPEPDPSKIADLEAALYHHYNDQSALMNGSIPIRPKQPVSIPDPTQVVQVMEDAEIAEKRDPVLRLPRQAAHYAQIVGHFLAVKNSKQISRAMNAHFERLRKYHFHLLSLDVPEESAGEDK